MAKNDAKEIKNKKNKPCLILVDFKAAFDSVNHQTLFHNILPADGFPKEIYYSIKYLYSKASFLNSFLFTNKTKINNGVM